MKNKLQLIDVSILSEYMGRWLTIVVTLVVLGITASALLTGRESSGRNIIRVCVPQIGADPLVEFEPLRMLFARETRRPVVMSVCTTDKLSNFDVLILPIHVYFEVAKELGIEAIYEVAEKSLDDSAVLIAKSDDPTIDLRTLSSQEVAFVDPTSSNGFWQQMTHLKNIGWPVEDSLRFEGANGDATRVVFGVLYGEYRAGACRMSDVNKLLSRNVIAKDELAVMYRSAVVPEIVIAIRADERAYYDRKLEAIARLLVEPPATADVNGPAHWLHSHFGKIRPLTSARLVEARTLFDRHQHRF